MMVNTSISMAYTAGVAPASNPRFALVVVINNPQAGLIMAARHLNRIQQIMGDVLRLEMLSQRTVCQPIQITFW